MSQNHTTHFGYRQVPKTEKPSLVNKVFDTVAPKYDLMNDLMSLGLHRLWKQRVVREANLRPGQIVLDVATGTGDLAKLFAKTVGTTGKVVMTDVNETMLALGRDKLTDAGFLNVEYIQANGEQLPFHNNYFDCISIAFGLRNITDKTAVLLSLYRILKPGGKLLILEFSHPQNSLISKLYDIYSFNIIPKLGEWITHDRDSYQYLVESIRMHPDQETLKNMLIATGFEDVVYINLNSGIVALHIGYKY
ncbi:MAG TPA: bifunctional demethylmenaquinone methyltransferase/2-methoxy-6-polyprenyl-1,4-benzoquinol methylase UbiE [Gammaproteobacteria bacterium]|nr:bifunctional demethylmenaquinone methyltransferase/2-methoxy-6-polyprenyl-1,4-benzoquinol methylase UbiE [Gammaproteobacteria bacterium]